jgi:hypothetical protein
MLRASSSGLGRAADCFLASQGAEFLANALADAGLVVVRRGAGDSVAAATSDDAPRLL